MEINRFAIPEFLAFDEIDCLTRISVASKLCDAEVFTQGAHLTRWQPKGHDQILFLSKRSDYRPGKAIRGGIPIIFPWFGARSASAGNSRTDGPSHGFARTSLWTFLAATINGDDICLKFGLMPNETSRNLGYDNFDVNYELTIGSALHLSLIVNNRSDTEMQFEEALHTYLLVGDAKQISISGLADTEYLDKTDQFKRKRQLEALLKLTGETDRPYANTEGDVTVNDPILKRRITVHKRHSKTTVVWNPWFEIASKLSDMDPDGWQQMVCVETANVGENAIKLAPGEKHTMETVISATKFELL